MLACPVHRCHPSGTNSFVSRIALHSLLICLLAATPGRAGADEALIAVAANFAPAAAVLKQHFEAQTRHRVRLAAGSTGKLYAQIVAGAPYDALLAADQWRPRELEQERRSVPGSRFTYAVGRLAIWIPGVVPPSQEDELASLLRGQLRIALANPELAPYGAAAREVLERLELADSLAARLALAENVAQAYAMVHGGAASAGFVAWSHVISRGSEAECLLVPDAWHAPIRQDALLLEHGAGNDAAHAFLAYLRTDAAKAVLTEQGYGA